MIKKFDKEYSTQYTPEMKYLQSKGINYSFVKDIQGVTTYKYHYDEATKIKGSEFKEFNL